MFNQGSENSQAPLPASANLPSPHLPTAASSATPVAVPRSPTPPTSTEAPTTIPVYTGGNNTIPTRLSRSGYADHFAHYVVGRGLRPGTHESWNQANRVTFGISGNKHKGFNDLQSAIRYCRKWWRVLTRRSAAVASLESCSHSATPDEVISAQIIWLVCVNKTPVTVLLLILRKYVPADLAGEIIRAIKYGTDSDSYWGPLRSLVRTIDVHASRALGQSLVLLSKTPPFRGHPIQTKCFLLLQHVLGQPSNHPAIFQAIRGIVQLHRRVINHMLLTLEKVITGDWRWTKELCADLDDKTVCHIVVTLRLLPAAQLHGRSAWNTVGIHGRCNCTAPLCMQLYCTVVYTCTYSNEISCWITNYSPFLRIF